MERKSVTEMPPPHKADPSSPPDPGFAAKDTAKAPDSNQEGVEGPNRSGVDGLLHTAAMTESVQEEIKGEDDALFIKSHSSETKKAQSQSDEAPVSGFKAENGDDTTKAEESKAEDTANQT